MSRFGLEYEPPISPPEDDRAEAAGDEVWRRWSSSWAEYTTKRQTIGWVIDTLIQDHGFDEDIIYKMFQGVDGDVLQDKLLDDLYYGEVE